MRYSLPQNIVRYSNGTLVKLTVSDHQFISYDYDPETDTGTYTPTSIRITAKYAGNLTYSKWQYTKDNSGWVDIPASNDLGITVKPTTLTILPSSSLFDKVNSFVMFRAVATDNDTGEAYTDTAEIERIVDYIILYRKQQTDIDQTADKIALIASDEQLRQYGRTNTVVSDLAALKVTAQGIESVVAQKVGEAEVRSLISQSADAIRLMARALSWTSENSSLTEAGFLTITGGHIADYEINQNSLLCETVDEIGTIKHAELTGSRFEIYQKTDNPPITRPAYAGIRLENNTIGIRYKSGRSSSIDGTSINPLFGIAFYSGEGGTADVWSNNLPVIGTIKGTVAGLNLSPLNEADAVNVFGDLVVTGTKSRIAKTRNYSERALFCYETPTPLFGDIGEAVLDEEGLCYVDLDDIFSETIADRVEYQVFLQKEGEGDCWIADKQPRFFVIKGTPGLKIAWELKAKQKGYETQRLEQFGIRLDEYKSVAEQDSLLDLYIREQEELLYG